MSRLSLVLTGGGARAAYQAGALRALAEIAPQREMPFSVIAGVSAGAVNSAYLAASAEDFRGGTEGLWNLWSGLHVDNIFRTDAPALFGTGLRLLKDLTSGGILQSRHSPNLLKTDPFRQLLDRHVDFDRINEYVESGRLYAFGVTATNYLTGTTVTFYNAHPDVEDWQRSQRISRRARITCRHVLASTAIPIFFPPVALDGSYYGDGCIRQSAPLSPAIHMGGDRIVAIGVRYARSERQVRELNQRGMEEVYLADIAGTMLNAVFLDLLEGDLDRLERINRTISLMPSEHRESHPDALRFIPVRAIRPSQDLGGLVSNKVMFSPTLRYLFKGLGASETRGADVMSYLAFESTYTQQLLELGYQDTMSIRDQMYDFFKNDVL